MLLKTFEKKPRTLISETEVDPSYLFKTGFQLPEVETI
jgi:hypothetical protein